MGAVVNMRPDLFNAVIMGVPFVDVLTTMADETIPLTSIEWEEWGNPAVSPCLHCQLLSVMSPSSIRHSCDFNVQWYCSWVIASHSAQVTFYK